MLTVFNRKEKGGETGTKRCHSDNIGKFKVNHKQLILQVHGTSN